MGAHGASHGKGRDRRGRSPGRTATPLPRQQPQQPRHEGDAAVDTKWHGLSLYGPEVVFVGNLPHSASEEEICRLFGGEGGLLQVGLLRKGGQSLGCGFLKFHTAEAAAAARAADSWQLHGRQLRLRNAYRKNGSAGQP